MTEEQELGLFTIKSKFFREVPHPKLILKAINQVEKMISGNIPAVDLAEIDFSESGLFLVLKSHTARVYELKAAISKAESASDLFLALNELYRWHTGLVTVLLRYLPELPNYPDDSIKQSAEINSYELSRFLAEANLSETEIKPYICTQLETGAVTDFSILTRAVLQCRKMTTHG